MAISNEPLTAPVSWRRIGALAAFFVIGAAASARFVRPLIGDGAETFGFFTIIGWLYFGFVKPRTPWRWLDRFPRPAVVFTLGVVVGSVMSIVHWVEHVAGIVR